MVVKSKFFGNGSEEADGGGIWISGAANGSYIIEHSTFENNHAHAFGGGLAVKRAGTAAPTVEIRFTEFKENSARLSGGGIYSSGNTTFGAGVKVLDSILFSKRGIGLDVVGGGNAIGRNGVEFKGDQYIPSSGSSNPDENPSSINIETGSEAVFSGQIIYVGGVAGMRNAGTFAPVGFRRDWR